MKDIKILFEYQKFKPNAALQSKINAVTAKYLSAGVEIDDDELDVSAAGEPSRREFSTEKGDADDE